MEAVICSTSTAEREPFRRFSDTRPRCGISQLHIFKDKLKDQIYSLPNVTESNSMLRDGSRGGKLSSKTKNPNSASCSNINDLVSRKFAMAQPPNGSSLLESGLYAGLTAVKAREGCQNEVVLKETRLVMKSSAARRQAGGSSESPGSSAPVRSSVVTASHSGGEPKI